MADQEPNTARREGDPEGSPSVLFDPQERRHYHLDRLGNRIYHAVPEGFQPDEAGALTAISPAPEPPAKPGLKLIAPTAAAVSASPEPDTQQEG